MNEHEDFQFPTAESRHRGNGSNGQGSTAGMRESLAQARQRIGETMTHAQERSRQVVDSTSGYIQRWPFSAIAVAAGVGLLIGWMLAGQSREEDSLNEHTRWWR